MAELRPTITWMLQEFYDRLKEEATKERQHDCPRDAERDGRLEWAMTHQRARRPNRLHVAVQLLMAYFAYPVDTDATREAEGRAAQFGQPAPVVMPRITRLTMVQAIIKWLWCDLRTLNGGLLLCRIVRHYVLHDIEWAGLEDRLAMRSSEAAGEGMLTAGQAAATVAGSHDCPRCLWTQVTGAAVEGREGSGRLQ